MRELLLAIVLAIATVGGVLLVSSPFEIPPTARQEAIVETTATPSFAASQPRAPGQASPAAVAGAPPPAADRGHDHGSTATTDGVGGQGVQQPSAAPAQRVAQAPVAQAPAAETRRAASPAAAPGDPQAGRQVYRKCQACHSLDAGRNLVGPSLAAIIGKKAASDSGFNY